MLVLAWRSLVLLGLGVGKEPALDVLGALAAGGPKVLLARVLRRCKAPRSGALVWSWPGLVSLRESSLARREGSLPEDRPESVARQSTLAQGSIYSKYNPQKIIPYFVHL